MLGGELAIVLHTHMPYVEGFGNWPFGEEWLWEAVATSYLPLLEVLDRHGVEATREQLTLSLTPVLCDQLEAPGALERCLAFLRDVRPASHRLDIEGFEQAGEPEAIRVLERSAAEYAAAADGLERLLKGTLDGGLLQALGAHATWTSSATHAILPLLALDESQHLQVAIGISSHRERFGEWGGGFWLPECAHAPWLDPLLNESGVLTTCVELTGLFGRGDQRHLAPIQDEDGLVLLPIDRQTIDLVWGHGGYPSRGAYRDYHRRTLRDHHVWANDGGFYDHDRAREQAHRDAHDFLDAAELRLADGGLCVCALDTELLGHWWYEGPIWLDAVLRAAPTRGFRLTALNEATLDRHPSVQAHLPDAATSWGQGGDLRTWSAPDVADVAWQARTAELRAFGGHGTLPPRALRELLALQSSDWAFLAYRDWAGDYPRQRASGHAVNLARALKGETDTEYVRNLAPYLNHS